MNLFAYANLNPINAIDPLGLIFIYDKSDKKLHWVEDAYGADLPATKSWGAVSGPWPKGPLPNGMYYLTGEETPVPTESNSMTDSCEEANTYKFRLHPQFDTDRDGLLIHPDGGTEGTAGCIGAKGCTKSLRDFINFRIDKPNGKGNAKTDQRLPVYVRD